MERKTIKTERGNVAYWIHSSQQADAPCIVFCHGVTADHTLFDQQLNFWSKRTNIITWDMPLHGDSRPYQDFTYDHVVDDLHSILDVESMEQVILVGQSAGGYICQAFIQAHPHRVTAFIGIGTTPFGPDYLSRSDRFWLRRFTAIAKLYPFARYCKASAKQACYTAASKQSLHTALEKLGQAGMLTAAQAVYDELMLRNEKVHFTCPVLLTHGQYDRTGKVSKYNQTWAAQDQLPLYIIPDAAHNANYDNPQAFNQRMLEFLNQHQLI